MKIKEILSISQQKNLKRERMEYSVVNKLNH